MYYIFSTDSNETHAREHLEACGYPTDLVLVAVAPADNVEYLDPMFIFQHPGECTDDVIGTTDEFPDVVAIWPAEFPHGGAVAAHLRMMLDPKQNGKETDGDRPTMAPPRYYAPSQR